MEWLTFCFAILGCLSCASFLLYWCHRLTKNKDEFICGVLYILLLMILCVLIPLSIYIFWKNTIELIPSKSKSIIETLESNNDSLKNEIAIYKGMETDIKGANLEDVVFYITSNPKFYHYYPDCAGLSTETGKLKSEILEDAINEGRISCSMCDGAKSYRYDSEENYKERNNVTGVVYICTGETSTKYHSDPDCKGLSRCSGEIEEVSEEEADDMGRTPCKICY